MAEHHARAVVFDAYGTLFDVAAVRQACAGIAADPAGFVGLWRAKQLEHAFLRSLMGRYADFEVRRATRCATPRRQAASRSALPTRRPCSRRGSRWRPSPTLSRRSGALKARGLKLAILSNGTPAMLDRLVRATGLAGMFDRLLSVDAVRRYKPDPAVYALIGPQLGVGAPRRCSSRRTAGTRPARAPSAYGSPGSAARAARPTSSATRQATRSPAWPSCRRWSELMVSWCAASAPPVPGRPNNR